MVRYVLQRLAQVAQAAADAGAAAAAAAQAAADLALWIKQNEVSCTSCSYYCGMQTSRCLNVSGFYATIDCSTHDIVGACLLLNQKLKKRIRRIK